MKLCKGNLLDADVDAILHQVNCQGVMGSGLAKQIRNKYPSVYKHYHEVCSLYSSDQLLGKIQVVEVKRSGKTLSVVNVFGQKNYGTDRVQTDYIALRSCLVYVNDCFKNKSVGIPFGMSCGLAGGDWNIVSDIIKEELRDCDVTIYKLE